MYEINFIALILELVPAILQFPVILGYTNALVTPIKGVYSDFKSNRTQDWYVLNHNGQVCYLRGALNDKFDSSERRIYIVDGNQYQRFYIYSTAENKPKYLGTKFIRLRSDYADTGVDFIVVCPYALRNDINPFEINALIDKYKLVSKRHKVEFV